MTVTFSTDVPEAARKTLAWGVQRSHDVGLPVKRIKTARPGKQPDRRGFLMPEDRITYLVAKDETTGNFHVTVDTA